MRRLLVYPMAALWCAGGLIARAQTTDLPARLARFSDCKKLDLRRLEAGEIASERGALMDFANGISAQLCYIVRAPPAETANRLRTWDFYEHHVRLSSRPAPYLQIACRAKF